MVETAEEKREKTLENELNGYCYTSDKNESEMTINEFKDEKEELLSDFDVHMTRLELSTFRSLKTKSDVSRFVNNLINKRLEEED